MAESAELGAEKDMEERRQAQAEQTRAMN